MNNRLDMLARKTLFGFSLAMICGGFTACTDDYDLDDEGNYPSWMGGSIYQTLKNPGSLESSGSKMLTGTFNTYLRLIDDLKKTDDMDRTGSVTVFPANDEAFERFFAHNAWNVHSYEELTEGMKRQLLYTSMLNNALLVEMLSNVSRDATSVNQGMALKHETSADPTDAMVFMQGEASMPANNPYWTKYYDKGINVVADGTSPQMVHFTKEYMVNNGITYIGKDGIPSDFEVITGTPYDNDKGSAYIFRNKIINPDVTCKNGYIHQMQDVLVPPGNMAEVIRTNGESNMFSRMMERFSVPYPNNTITRTYNDNAVLTGAATIDTIFEKRYFSQRSQNNAKFIIVPGSVNEPAPASLNFDPGWNAYNDGVSNSDAKSNIAAIFVPTDDAIWQFFKPGGQGEFLITQYGKLPNTQENLGVNLDSIPLDNVESIINNLMQSSFKNSVPSKFNNVMDEAMDPMGLTLDVINKGADGTFDVKIANNGVIYMLNTMFAPPSLICVAAPVKLSDNMKVMAEAVYDGQRHTALGLNQNFYVYLLAMSANYAFFIPTDDAFERYYIDPGYLNEDQPRALKFKASAKSPFITCEAYTYNKETGEIGSLIGEVEKAEFNPMLIDILNYHTVVLGKGEVLGGQKYYKTKHGGAISINFAGDSLVMGGQQINNHISDAYKAIAASKITRTYNQANGHSYAINRVIQPPFESVYSVLKDTKVGGENCFSEFYQLCTDLDMDDIMRFASDKLGQNNATTKKPNLLAYHPFVTGGLDQNVNYFKSYNYTVYAPDNTAMREAYSRGLPKWSDIKKLYDQYNDQLQAIKDGDDVSATVKAEVQAARDKALAMVNEINSFVRYHFQDNSVYADKTVKGGNYPTACTDTLGLSVNLKVNGGNGKLYVTDKKGETITIDANSSQHVSNKMTRDYVFNRTQNNVTGKITKNMTTSSFAVVHQISKPLSTHTSDRYDAMWSGAGARKRLANYRKQFEEKLYKRYQ